MSIEVGRARARFEREIDGVRTTLDREWGWAPQGARWILPVAAIAAGFVAGGNLRRRLRGRRGERRLLDGR